MSIGLFHSMRVNKEMRISQKESIDTEKPEIKEAIITVALKIGAGLHLMRSMTPKTWKLSLNMFKKIFHSI